MILPPAFVDLPPQHQVCLVQASQDYSVPVLALMAIWAAEGGEVGVASKPNADKTRDYGPFQINTFWLVRFRSWFGVHPVTVRDDFCMNAKAAGWVLRYSINLKKGDFWDGVGAYHAPFNSARASAYKVKVKYAADVIFQRESLLVARR